MKKVWYVSLLAVSATVLTFSACTKDAKEDLVSESNISVAHAMAAPSCGTSEIVSVFLSMGHSSNGAWGLNADGTQVASELNYGPTGNNLDGIVNPQIVGSPNNLPCDLLNFTAVGGDPYWFGGRHNLGVGDDFISGSEALIVTLGEGLTGRRASSAVANLTGSASAAIVQLLLDGSSVGSPLEVTLGNASPISAGGALFNGLRISAKGSGDVSITGTPQRPRQAIQFNLVSQATLPCLSINANWAQGAVTVLNGTAHAAGTNTVCVTNDPSTGRVVFRDWNTFVIGRTNGAGDNGTATDAFSYKINAWNAAVPFAYGTRSGKDAIWTPQYQTSGINGVYMAEFVQDNQSGDQDLTVGTIRVGNWRAVQLTVLDNNGVDTRKRVSIEELVNGNWVQRVRPNNNNGIVEMRSFAVLQVRTNYTITGGKVTAQTIKSIPVLKSQLVGINNSISNGPIILWTLQIGGQVSFNNEMFRP